MNVTVGIVLIMDRIFQKHNTFQTIKIQHLLPPNLSPQNKGIVTKSFNKLSGINIFS